MAEASSSSGSDIMAMKETLCAQQQLLQKLYAELDEEREASATAASEALDMILRLQGEKAAVKMEACQYARMAEEKIEHAETTLEILEEILFQKDMEIASLEFQVQAYKRKLDGLGYDPNLNEFEFPGKQVSQRNDDPRNGENSSVRRLNSLPPIPLNKKTARKRERSPSPLPPSMIPRIVEQKSDHEVISQNMDLARKSVDPTHGTLDSYWEQIKRLDEKVKEMSDCKEKEGDKCSNPRGRRNISCSPYSRYSRGRSKTPFITNPELGEQRGEVKQDREAIADPSCSVNVHDVFEVPHPRGSHRVSEHGKHRGERLGSEAENRLTKPDPEVHGEKFESHFKYDSGKLMKILGSNRESRAHGPTPSDHKITSMFGLKKEGMSVECNGEAEFHALSGRIERLERERERERLSTRHEIAHERDGEEQLRLLKEILSQLKSMQEEMRSSKIQGAPLEDDVPFDSLQEAMLYFWI